MKNNRNFCVRWMKKKHHYSTHMCVTNDESSYGCLSLILSHTGCTDLSDYDILLFQLRWLNTLCGLSPVWVNMWRLRDPAWRNNLLHCTHLWGFSPVWMVRWVLKLPARLNDLLHGSHLCIFSPLWVVRCFLRVSARPNVLLHSAHLCHFSPVCITMWRLKTLASF